MELYSAQGANVVVGGRRFIFAPSVLQDVPDDVGQYLISTNQFFPKGYQAPSLEADKPVKIGVYRIGGFGDGILGGCCIRAIKRKFPNSHIYGCTFSQVRKMWEGHPDIMSFDDSHKPRPLNLAATGNYEYELFFNMMPDCGAWVHPSSIRFYKYRQDLRDRGEIIEHYKRRDTRNHLTLLCRERSMEALDVYNFLYDTDAKITDAFIPRKSIPGHIKLPNRYVTVHDWAFNGRQTKSWFPERWHALNEMIKKEFDCPIVQIGAADEEYLFPDIDLRGRLEFWESMEVVRGSIFHMDNESTAAHVCAAMQKPCAVLCGATSTYWRHKENLNITGDYHCQECEGAPDWYKTCNDAASFGCMKSISPELAFAKIKPYMTEKLCIN